MVFVFTNLFPIMPWLLIEVKVYIVSYRNSFLADLYVMQAAIENVVERGVKEKKHILVATMDTVTGEVSFSGDQGWIKAIEDEPDLKNNIVTKLIEASKEDDPDVDFEKASLPKHTYPKLSFDIMKPLQTPQKNIRDSLNNILKLQGYGLNKLKRSLCKNTNSLLFPNRGPTNPPN